MVPLELLCDGPTAVFDVCFVFLVCANSPDLVRHLQCHILAILDWYLPVHLHLLEILHLCLSCLSNSCWVQLAVIHVVPLKSS